MLDVAGGKFGCAQRGVGGGKPRQLVRVVHLQQQLSGMDLVAHIDVDLLDLARDLRMGLVIGHRLYLAICTGGLVQVLIADLVGTDADALACEHANRIDRHKDDNEGCPPDYKRRCAI